MSLKSDYNDFITYKDRLLCDKTTKYWINQEERYIEPFQIFGNLYYVGDTWVCVHIVDTGAGLLMLDAGNCGNTALLIESIWEMGFRPEDVKWIILSHGHADHFGAVGFFRRMYGTKIYMGEPDVRMFENNPEQSVIQATGNVMESLFEVDYEIKDGDVLTFGNTTIRFYLVPGHTKGCIACFFDVTDGKCTKHAGYYGGFGFNTLQKEFLEDIGDYEYVARREYAQSIDKVIDEPVDIFVGNHTSNVDLINKRNYMIEHPGSNPFIDSTAWKKYLGNRKKELMLLEEKERN